MSQSRNELVLDLPCEISQHITRESSCCSNQREIEILKNQTDGTNAATFQLGSVLVCEDPNWNACLDAVRTSFILVLFAS